MSQSASLMTLREFRVACIRAMDRHRDWRPGQSAFNTLAEHRPELAEQVRATNHDPFYARKVEDPRFQRFVEWVELHW